LKCHANKVVVAPNQPAPTRRVEIIKRNVEFGRHDLDAVQPNSCASVRDISDAAGLDALSARKIHQHAAISYRSAESAPLNRTRLKHLPKSWHYALQLNKAAKRSMIA
jgi:hypothetical protein